MREIKQIYPIFGHICGYKYDNKSLEITNELIDICCKAHICEM